MDLDCDGDGDGDRRATRCWSCRNDGMLSFQKLHVYQRAIEFFA